MFGTDVSLPPLRLAVIGTPRSGNTWVRGLLSTLYGLEEIAVHHPDEIPWDSLPRRCVIQLHWFPVEPFTKRLAEAEFRVVVPSRHPLDVICSWLNYQYYVHLEGYCLGEGICNECAIIETLPRSESLLKYVSSEAGRGTLCVSAAWWFKPGVIQTRYEALVAEPEAALGRLLEAIGIPPSKTIAEALAAHSEAAVKPRQEAWHFHFWQGRPGLWKMMFPAEESRAIFKAVPEPFEMLGYDCDPDETLDGTQADVNWLSLQISSTREQLALEHQKRRKEVEAKTHLHKSLAWALASLENEQQAHRETREALNAAEARQTCANGSTTTTKSNSKSIR